MKRWTWLAGLGALLLMLTGCLFRPPDDLYKLPEAPADYDQLKEAISEVRSGLDAEFGSGTDVAVIISGDNTATTQLQDLDGDGVRESAVTFFKVSGTEKPLKIYIFSQYGEDYEVTGVVEGDGASIYAVDYVDLNGSGEKELVVCWQVSTGVYQLGAYTLDELHRENTRSTAKGQSGRSDLLATQLLLTSCSAAVDGSSLSGGYTLLDFDRDTRTEIVVVRVDSGSGTVEVYGWQDGAVGKVGGVGLSAGVSALNRIRSNFLMGELYPPALYVISTLEDNSRVIDVLAYQKDGEGKEKHLVNLALDPETGVSRELLQGYTDIMPTDINGDSVVELPTPTLLPSYGETISSNFWLIDWAQYDETGERSLVKTTYHNLTDSWYLEIPEEWRDKITISRNDQVSGQREVIFSLWQGEEEPPQAFLSVYRLTGNNRAAMVARGSRFVLREEESVIYAARFYPCDWDCGLEEADLLDRFKTIQAGWYYG